MSYNKQQIIKLTKVAIENSQEYQDIIDRIINRAKLGYSYVKFDSDFVVSLSTWFIKIKNYLEAQGYKSELNAISEWKISWDFKNE